MTRFVLSLLAGATLLLSSQHADAACPLGPKCSDAEAVASARAEIAAQCDCAGSKRKAYVKCVKKQLKRAVKEGLPKKCRKYAQKCEKKSTCGRQNAAICCEAKKSGRVKAWVASRAKRCEQRGGLTCGTMAHAVDACTEAGLCVQPPEPEPEPEPPAVKAFKLIQEEIFASSCDSQLCHSSLTRQGDLDLSSEDVSYHNLVEKPAKSSKDGLMLVKSGDPENSFLIRKLRGILDPAAGEGTSMPQGAPLLPESVLRVIEDWIRRGAHSTAEECPALVEGGTLSSSRTAAHGTDGVETICDDEPIDTGDFVWTKEAPLAAPAAHEGFQLYAPPKAVEPGGEWEYCYIPSKDTLGRGWEERRIDVGVQRLGQVTIRRQEYRMHQGSHHLLVYSYFGAHPEDWTYDEWFPCSAASCRSEAPEHCPDDVGQNLIPIGGTQVAGTLYEVEYPQGVGFPVPLLSQLSGNPPPTIIINLHYQNPFLPPQPIEAEAWLNFYFHAPGEFKVQLDGIFAINFGDLKVEPYETRTISRIWRPRSFVFGSAVNASVFNLFGHMHKRGTLFQVDIVKDGTCSGNGDLCGRDSDCPTGQTCTLGPNPEDTTIYRTTQWDNAPVVDYPPPYLSVKKEEGLRWTCTHENGRKDENGVEDPRFPAKRCESGCRACGWDPASQQCIFTRFEPRLAREGDPVPAGQDGVACQPADDSADWIDCTSDTSKCGGSCRQTYRAYAAGEPMPLVFGELADDDMCNMFGYMVFTENLCLLDVEKPADLVCK
jgi:hypothetical protein